MKPIRLSVVALTMLLAACAGAPVAPAVDPAALEAARNAQLARELALRTRDHWALAGRVAISNGGKGGSGRIDWQQSGAGYVVSLGAPVTRQSWRLSGDAQGARLEGIEGGPRFGRDPSQLLREATGWEIPVTALLDWVRGMRAEGLAVEAEQFDAQGRLERLQQGGWVIDYRWPEVAGTEPALPQRIEAVRGEAKVRLIVDQWELPVPQVQAPSPEAQLRQVVAGLDLGDPAADMRTAVARGDRRPLAVCGYACSTPGLEQAGAAGEAGANIIDGTGDVVSGQGHLALKQVLADYVQAYNRALAQWLATSAGAND